MNKLYDDLKNQLNAKRLEIPLDRVHGNLNREGATVQINVKPCLHLNAIHFALFQILSVCIDKGYKCSIVLADKSIVSQDAAALRTEKEIRNAMDFFYKNLLKFKLDPNKIEVIPQSVLWQFAGFRENSLEQIYKISYLLNNKKDEYLKNARLQNSFPNLERYINVLFSIIYESLLKPDFIVTVEEEMTPLWQSLRERETSQKIFGIDYIPPVMIVLETIRRYNNATTLKTNVKEDDPFCDCMSKANLQTITLRQHYENSIMSYYNINPFTNANTALEVIKAFRKRVYDEDFN
jgi:hypothetical protein